MATTRDLAKERYWRDVIRRQRQSGLSIRAYCEENGLKEPSFYWWRRNLDQRHKGRARRPVRGKAAKPVRRRGVQNDSAFVPVGLPFSVEGLIEIVHPRGHVIRVPAIFDPSTLGRVLAVIDATAGESEER